MVIFKDRTDAGKKLAEALSEYSGHEDVILLALPRGGVPVAFEVAKELDVELDVFIVRKLGVPGYEELAMGAISSGGVKIMNMGVVQSMQITGEAIDSVVASERVELERREEMYRKGKPELDVTGKTAILIDDGLATGATMKAAFQALRKQNPDKIIVAVPTASREACDEFAAEVDRTVCLTTPEPFYGVGAWYENFAQTSDKEVCDLLKKADEMAGPVMPSRG
ncbi:phosphoribosyltransferase [Methanolobus halotolerans]|uniref:Phosphoribosyl transferase n=1 Tax=Methanolobus halotolerans TaxID=2052935 RepID=A0A4E0Q678_9EURY|nr:phosphoribosyltransferase [Methanolobus halotolerans]TGC09506.1 phosphoribosyl transferase [Methanolobus halotolerans]